MEGADFYSLGGFSKHGYPGVCVVEGQLENVLAFVRQIQQLRWKFMVVRGEEIEVLWSAEGEGEGEGEAGSGEGDQDMRLVDAVVLVNNARKLPAFREIESMSEAATICKSGGVHDLFLTVMKK